MKNPFKAISVYGKLLAKVKSLKAENRMLEAEASRLRAEAASSRLRAQCAREDGLKSSLSGAHDFPWLFQEQDKEARVRAFRDAFQAPGFKELLSNNVYAYKRRAIEAKGTDAQALYYAEAYQGLLDKMRQSHLLLVGQHPSVHPGSEDAAL